VLDLERYRPRDCKFAAGVLALASCPRKQPEALAFVDAFMSARRALKMQQRPSKPDPTPALD
jgi:hypothetical protein